MILVELPVEIMFLDAMFRVAKEAARDLMGQNAVGVILFGSLAKGTIDEMSDVDLAVVLEGEIKVRNPEVRHVEGFEVEIWRYSIEHFKHVFEDEKYRRKEDSWFLASLWISLLREGIILEDPKGILGEWKKKALAWKWELSEILPVFNKSESCLKVAEESYRRGIVFEGIVAVRDACFNLAIVEIMLQGDIPSIRPKDLYSRLIQRNFREFFDEVQGLKNLKKQYDKELLVELKELLDIYWKEPRGARTEYLNAVKSLARGKTKEALLNARSSAFYVGRRILRIKGKSIPFKLYDAKTHLEMMSILKDCKEFIKLYQKLHNMNIDKNYLKKCIKSTAVEINRLKLKAYNLK